MADPLHASAASGVCVFRQPPYFFARQEVAIAARTRESRSPANNAVRQFAVAAARLAADRRCQRVVVLDVRGLSPVTDYFIIATGTSPRQMRTVCEEVMELAQQMKQSTLSDSGLDGDTWMLVDFVDVMFHLFSEQARDYYDLEGLWGDAKAVNWEEEAPPSDQAAAKKG